MKRRLSLILSLCLVLILCTPIGNLNAAATYKLNAKTRTLNGVGKKCTLTLTAPKGTKAAWKSSNSKIASVTSKGVVTAKKRGTVTITCTAKKNTVTKKLTCKVTVKVPAKAIEFTNAIIDSEYDAHVLVLGTTYDFNARRISSSTKSASTDVIRFYVKDPAKAIVNEKTGLVTPLKSGYTTLTVCCGATAEKAIDPDNPIKQTINLFITKPSVTVKDVSLANSHELQITFSQPINSSTVLSGTFLTSGIFIQSGKDAAEIGTLTGALSEDKKVLTITNKNAFNGTYNISLRNTILSETGYALTPYTENKVLKDTINPTYLGCSVDDTGLVVSLNFSEPISIDNLVPSAVKRPDKITMVYTSPFTTKSNYKLSKDKKSILLDLTGIAPADQNVAIEVTLYGIVDLANNPTNPYPLVASIYTNTTGATQAELVNAYRNGNSLVAAFNKSIQAPGYAIVNGSFLSGEVNKTNKKEVIYHINDTSLLNCKTGLNVVFYNYSTYNAGATSTTAQRTVNFGSGASLPTITNSSFTTKKVNSITSNVLTLTFNQTVTLLERTGQITGRSTLDGIVGANTKYQYTAEAVDNTVTLTLTGSFTELATYTFSIPDSFVMDAYYNYNAGLSVTAAKLAGETSVLPGPRSIQIAGTANQHIYVTFDNMLDQSTAENKDNYNISGITIQSAQLVCNTYNCPAIVKLTVVQNSIIDNAPYVVKISGLRGYKSTYTTMEPYENMIILSNNQTLEPATVTAVKDTITLAFPTPLISGTPTNIDYAIAANGTAVTVKSVNVNGSTVTITLTKELTAGQSLLLKPSQSNYLIDVNNKKLLNMPLSVIVS
nr:Ig-like domain-containing protein [uncultured Lachnoclostridium sp.]